MKNFRILGRITGGVIGAFICAFSVLAPNRAEAMIEQTFDVLQIGSQTYRNVTVTTKSKNYVFLLHSRGMTNVRVADLTPELKTRLGYAEDKPKPKGFAPVLAKLEPPGLKTVGDELGQSWRDNTTHGVLSTPQGLLIVAGAAILVYLFFCYCCHLICEKSGQRPGLLVWFPVFKVFPLLRAANMSSWWSLALLVPVLNLIASIVWAFKIVEARSKSVWVGILLLLPLTNLLAFLYLAFSAAPAPKERRVVEVMTLDAA